jgi:flagellar hook-basal body complex protein FliE
MDISNISQILSNNNIKDFKVESNQEKINFGEILNEALNKVNDNQLYADEMDRMLATGEVDNVHEVTIAAQKAQLTLNLAVEIKSQLMEAYNHNMILQI